jgi:hypothetical protein
LYSRKSVPCSVLLDTPCPQNRKQKRQRTQVKDYCAEEYEGEELDYYANRVNFKQAFLDFARQFPASFIPLTKV